MPPLRKLIFALAAFVAIGLGSAGAIQAQSNAYFDFHGPPNAGYPANPWQYGVDRTGVPPPTNTDPNPPPPDNFTLYDLYAGTPGGPGTAFGRWSGAFGNVISDPTANVPAVIKDGANLTTPDTQGTPGLGDDDLSVAGQNALLLIPENSSTIVRYVSSGAGDVLITGFFQGIHPASPTEDPTTSTLATYARVGILRGIVDPMTGAISAVSLFSYDIVGRDYISFNIATTLAAGESLFFYANYLPAVQTNDGVLFNATVIPEPTTLLLLGISGLGVAGAVFRYRRKSEEEADDTDDGVCAA